MTSYGVQKTGRNPRYRNIFFHFLKGSFASNKDFLLLGALGRSVSMRHSSYTNSTSQRLPVNGCYNPNCFHKLLLNGASRLPAYLPPSSLYIRVHDMAIIVRIAVMKPAEQYEQPICSFVDIFS